MSVTVERRFVEFWRERKRIRRTRDKRAARQAESDLERIVNLLVRRFGAERIIVFGSLVRGDFSDESDIDLAVEGIARRDYFEALGAVNGMTRRWVDLKPLEDLEPHFRHRVVTQGRQLYGTEDCERTP
jgi:predicted nucleotidyltransferase